MLVVWLISNRPLTCGYGRIPIEDQKCWKTAGVFVGSDLEAESESQLPLEKSDYLPDDGNYSSGY